MSYRGRNSNAHHKRRSKRSSSISHHRVARTQQPRLYQRKDPQARVRYDGKAQLPPQPNRAVFAKQYFQSDRNFGARFRKPLFQRTRDLRGTAVHETQLPPDSVQLVRYLRKGIAISQIIAGAEHRRTHRLLAYSRRKKLQEHISARCVFR